MKPTTELYNALQLSYDHFNKKLFNGQLPDIIFTVQRINRVMGYFSANRWKSNDGKRCHEIAINPEYVATHSVIEMMQTLVHEMVHCWQHCYGKPSIRTYHNKEFAFKMESVGLMPSDTGRVGGKKVGQKMSDYPIPNGQFIKECKLLIKEDSFKVNWVDAHARTGSIINDEIKMNNIIQALSLEAEDLDENSELIGQLTATVSSLLGEDTEEHSEDISEQKNYKIKYSCPSCEINTWGKPNLNLICGDCKEALIDC